MDARITATATATAIANAAYSAGARGTHVLGRHCILRECLWVKASEGKGCGDGSAGTTGASDGHDVPADECGAAGGWW